MPKKRKKVKKRVPIKKKTKSKKIKKRIYKKIKKRSKKKLKTNIKNRNIKENSVPELIIKTKPEWIKSGLANKAQYQKNIMNRSRTIILFGKKREKELIG